MLIAKPIAILVNESMPEESKSFVIPKSESQNFN